MRRLSENLLPIYNLELQTGNEVSRIDEPAGSDCPLAIIFKQPLHLEKIKEVLKLTSSVRRWENRDEHYPLEAGFVCDETKQVLDGPLR